MNENSFYFNPKTTEQVTVPCVELLVIYADAPQTSKECNSMKGQKIRKLYAKMFYAMLVEGLNITISKLRRWQIVISVRIQPLQYGHDFGVNF